MGSLFASSAREFHKIRTHTHIDPTKNSNFVKINYSPLFVPYPTKSNHMLLRRWRRWFRDGVYKLCPIILCLPLRHTHPVNTKRDICTRMGWYCIPNITSRAAVYTPYSIRNKIKENIKKLSSTEKEKKTRQMCKIILEVDKWTRRQRRRRWRERSGRRC